ncbi:MAG: hypothetical protein U0228_31260 [Myxococcaceae bacterium]
MGFAWLARVRAWVVMVTLGLLGCGAVSSGNDGGTGGGSATGGGSGATGGGSSATGGGSSATGGGSSATGGGGATTPFCAACVTSAECGTGSLCLGGVEARCGKDCSATFTCAEGATCQSIGLGKGPRLGAQCLAADTPSCGAFTRKSGLDCSDTWSGYGQNFFATVCIGACHRHDAAWTTVTDVRLSADSIRLSVESGSMPQLQTLTEAERLRLLTWLACGAP